MSVFVPLCPFSILCHACFVSAPLFVLGVCPAIARGWSCSIQNRLVSIFSTTVILKAKRGVGKTVKRGPCHYLLRVSPVSRSGDKAVVDPPRRPKVEADSQRPSADTSDASEVHKNALLMLTLRDANACFLAPVPEKMFKKFDTCCCCCSCVVGSHHCLMTSAPFSFTVEGCVNNPKK